MKAIWSAGLGRVKQSGFDVAKLPHPVRDYAARASNLHDVYLARKTSALARAY